MGGPEDGAYDENGFDNKRKPAQPVREYVDYDDPTQFDGQGQRLDIGQQSAAQQTQMQIQQAQQQLQQQMLYIKQGGGNSGSMSGGQGSGAQGGGDRQLVSYDDLF